MAAEAVLGGGGGGGSSWDVMMDSSRRGPATPKPVCPECGNVYSNNSNLKQHIANVHAPTQHWESCQVCGKQFKTKQYLQRGCIPGGAGAGESRPVCGACGRVYSSVSNLKQHMANVHSTAPNWEPCPVCGKHFKTRQYLFNHLLQTHGIRQRASRMPLPPHLMQPPPPQPYFTNQQQLPPHESQRSLTSAVEQCLEILTYSPKTTAGNN